MYSASGTGTVAVGRLPGIAVGMSAFGVPVGVICGTVEVSVGVVVASVVAAGVEVGEVSELSGVGSVVGVVKGSVLVLVGVDSTDERFSVVVSIVEDS